MEARHEQMASSCICGDGSTKATKAIKADKSRDRGRNPLEWVTFCPFYTQIIGEAGGRSFDSQNLLVAAGPIDGVPPSFLLGVA